MEYNECIDQELIDLSRRISILFQLPCPEFETATTPQLIAELTALTKFYGKQLLEFSDKVKELVKREPYDLSIKFKELYRIFKPNVPTPDDTVEVVGKIFKYTRNILTLQKQQAEELKHSKILKYEDEKWTGLFQKLNQHLLKQSDLISDLGQAMAPVSSKPQIPQKQQKNTDLCQTLQPILRQNNAKLIGLSKRALDVKEGPLASLYLKKQIFNLNNKMTGKESAALKKIVARINDMVDGQLTNQQHKDFQEGRNIFRCQIQQSKIARSNQRQVISAITSRIEFALKQLKSISPEILRSTILKELSSLKHIFDSAQVKDGQQLLEEFRLSITEVMNSQIEKQAGQIVRLKKQLRQSQDRGRQIQKRWKKAQDELREVQALQTSRVKQYESVQTQINDQKKARKIVEKQLKQSRHVIQQQRALTKDVDRYQKEITIQKEDIAEGIKERKILHQKIKQIQIKHSKEMTAKDEAERGAAALRRQCQHLGEICGQLQTKLKSFQEEKILLQNKLNSQNIQLNTMTHEINNVHQSHSSEVRQAKSAQLEAEQQLRAYKQHCQQSMQDVEILQGQLFNLQQTLQYLKEKDRQRSLLIEQNTRLNQLNDQLIEVNQSLVNQKTNVTRKLQKITQDAEAATLMASQYESCQSNYDRLREEMNKITHMLVERSNMQQAYQQQIDKYKEDISRHTKSKRKLDL